MEEQDKCTLINVQQNLQHYGGVLVLKISTLRQWRIYKFRKGGSDTGVRSTPENFWVATPTSGQVNAFMTHVIIVSRIAEIQTEYLKVKRLEICKELICETVPSCCCCMPLLHNHLMDSCGYVCQIHY